MSKRRVKLPTANDESAFQFTMARIMTLVGTPLLCALAWQLWTSQAEMQASLGELKTSIAVIQQRLQSDGDDKYKAVQARADFSSRDTRIADHEARLDAIEREVIRLRDIRGSVP